MKCYIMFYVANLMKNMMTLFNNIIIIIFILYSAKSIQFKALHN